MRTSTIGYILHHKYEDGIEEFANEPLNEEDWFDTTHIPSDATVWATRSQAEHARNTNNHWEDFEIRHVRIITETTVTDIEEEK